MFENSYGLLKVLEELLENLVMVNKRLSCLYTTVLQDLLKWNDKLIKSFSKIFSLILLGKRLLADNEINNLLELEFGMTHEVLSYFRSLIMFGTDKLIMIHHTFLKQYLTSPKSAKFMWHIDEQK